MNIKIKRCIFLNKPDSKIEAILDVYFSDVCLTISGVRAIQGSKGLFFAFPQKEGIVDGEKKYFNMAGIYESAAYNDFQKSIHVEYNLYKSQNHSKLEAAPPVKMEGSISEFYESSPDLPF